MTTAALQSQRPFSDLWEKLLYSHVQEIPGQGADRLIPPTRSSETSVCAVVTSVKNGCMQGMDPFFFLASKLIGALIRPDTWIIVLSGLSVFALLRGARRLALIAAAGLFAGLRVLTVVPLG